MAEPILLARDAGLATLTLNRPEALNALDLAMIDALVAHTTELAQDARVRCVVISGAGKHFMAGGDLREFARRLGDAPADRLAFFRDMVQRLHAAIENLQRLHAPVIASVHGAVAGFGLSLVGAADLAIAADDAYFSSAYRNIALTPDGGGTYTLPRLVGRKKAMEILLLSERFDAQEALRLGLVNRVVAPAALADATTRMVQGVLSGPPVALRNAKRLVYGSATSSLSAQLQAEALSFGECAATRDFVEGIEAFLAKRPAAFTGE